MVRNRVRTTDRQPITENMVKVAMAAIQEGHSKRAIALQLGVNESSLRKRLKKGGGCSKLGRFQTTFTTEMEQELAAHCRELDNRFYGLTFKSLQILAYQFAESNGIKHPFNKDKKVAGADWTSAFIARNFLSLRQPQNTSLGRAIGFNKVQVERFYVNLVELQRKHSFSPNNIFNMDESGISTVPNKLPKVVTSRNKKSVGKIVTGERGQLVTVVCAMNAAGNYIPPAFIFPRKYPKPELFDGAPPASLGLVSDSGYMNSVLFVKYLNHFQMHAKATPDQPVLLVLDNHVSHISIEAIGFCREHGIVMLSLPPHSSHRMQPLDKCFFGPLKKHYANQCDQWMINHPGRGITQFQVAALFEKAYSKCATVGNAVSAFKMCGICPIDTEIFEEVDFLPSEVTNVPLGPEGNNENEEEQGKDVPVATSMDISSTSETLPEPTTGVLHSVSDATASDSVGQSQPGASASKVSPSELLPFPKCKEIQIRRKRGKKSEILSSSPYFKEAKAAQEMKDTLATMKVERVSRRLFAKTAKVAAKLPDKEKAGRKALRRMVAGGQNEPTAGTSGQEAKKEAKITCPACSTVYVEPPVEEWIQCSRCEKWWHEECSAYDSIGVFKCDLC